jgi:RNA polymerase sigma factor (sigma-70 family)
VLQTQLLASKNQAEGRDLLGDMFRIFEDLPVRIELLASPRIEGAQENSGGGSASNTLQVRNKIEHIIVWRNRGLAYARAIAKVKKMNINSRSNKCEKDGRVEQIASSYYLKLHIAVQRFDYRLGFHFSTYACNSFRSVRGALDSNPGLFGRTERQPSAQRIADSAELNRLTLQLGHKPSTEEKERGLGGRRTAQEVFVNSLDAITSNSGSPLANMLPGRPAESTLEAMAREDEIEALHAAISKLPGDMGEIVKLYFGFSDCQSQTLTEIAESTGLSFQRIQQKLRTAVSKLQKILGQP